MNTVYLNNIVSKENLRYPLNYIKQIQEILSIIDSKINKSNILKMTLYYTSPDCFDDIYKICNTWKPINLEIEYIGNYVNPIPLIQMMISIIAKDTPKINANYQNVNYII
jgi:hypothetical protein